MYATMNRTNFDYLHPVTSSIILQCARMIIFFCMSSVILWCQAFDLQTINVFPNNHVINYFSSGSICRHRCLVKVSKVSTSLRSNKEQESDFKNESTYSNYSSDNNGDINHEMLTSTDIASNNYFSTMIKNLFSIPNPSGLSHEMILDMARNRFKTDKNIDQPMKGVVSVITGAAGGIGKELCHVIYSLGGTVVALDRNSQGLEELKVSLLRSKASAINETKDMEERILTIITHHEDLDSVAASADTIKSKFKSIDILVNNAGLTYNSESYVPGQDSMKSAHGNDLAFTVNYLSHFLLTTKLLSNLSSSRHRGRIVHVTSTYHWKVDGFEILPQQDGSVLAYESDPTKQSAKHIERSYANTKLAQIWHSRSIQKFNKQNLSQSKVSSSLPGCSSVCACPTWAATGIAGEESRSFLEKLAFPVANCGPGVTSVINAMLRTDKELISAAALDDGRCFVGNSRTMDYLRNIGTEYWMTSRLISQQLGWRDNICDFCGLLLLLGQRFTYDEFIVQETSPESYNDINKRDELYRWSYNEVEKWL